MDSQEPIIALATPPGSGAIAVIRVSGHGAIGLADPYFRPVGSVRLMECDSHTVHLGHIMENDKVLDEALVTVFRAPRSYTGEDVVEISCHGSPYIQREIIQLFLRNGCRMAQPGEFTLRAFLNGKMDLSQAEAVADLVASNNAAAHELAMRQMRGGFSHELQTLRAELLNFASLIELELDFSEEDVEFADRGEFEHLLTRILEVLKRLIDSFAVGNAIKNGIPVAIVGEPNVGKSTLLNAILKEDRAIVSEIAGTTRDTIEDEISLGGIGFRFIDTAGIRDARDTIERIGIQKTFDKIGQSHMVIYLFDAHRSLNDPSGLETVQSAIADIQNRNPDKPIVVLANKVDLLSDSQIADLTSKVSGVALLSAKTGQGVEELKDRLIRAAALGELRGDDTVVTNSRHYDALQKALEAVEKTRSGMYDDLPADLLAIDIRQALYHIGEITGQISSDDLLGNIFANFCIGK